MTARFVSRGSVLVYMLTYMILTCRSAHGYVNLYSSSSLRPRSPFLLSPPRVMSTSSPPNPLVADNSDDNGDDDDEMFSYDNESIQQEILELQETVQELQGYLQEYPDHSETRQAYTRTKEALTTLETIQSELQALDDSTMQEEENSVTMDSNQKDVDSDEDVDDVYEEETSWSWDDLIDDDRMYRGHEIEESTTLVTPPQYSYFVHTTNDTSFSMPSPPLHMSSLVDKVPTAVSPHIEPPHFPPPTRPSYELLRRAIQDLPRKLQKRLRHDLRVLSVPSKGGFQRPPLVASYKKESHHHDTPTDSAGEPDLILHSPQTLSIKPVLPSIQHPDAAKKFANEMASSHAKATPVDTAPAKANITKSVLGPENMQSISTKVSTHDTQSSDKSHKIIYSPAPPIIQVKLFGGDMIALRLNPDIKTKALLHVSWQTANNDIDKVRRWQEFSRLMLGDATDAISSSTAMLNDNVESPGSDSYHVPQPSLPEKKTISMREDTMHDRKTESNEAMYRCNIPCMEQDHFSFVQEVD